MNERTTDRATSTSKPRHIAKKMVFLIGLAAWSILIGLGIVFVKFVIRQRELARQSQCRGNLSQLTHALFNYHETYRCLPPAYIADADGKSYCRKSWMR